MHTRRAHHFGTTIFLCLIGLATCVSQQTMTKTLQDYLFTDYDKDLLPICNEGENVTVKIDLALRQVVELYEPRQILSTNVWLRLKWSDCRLTWNKSSYANLTHITVQYDNIWFPDITLYDSAAEEVMFPGRESYSAYISNTGSVAYNFPTVLTSVCRVNVRYFPFDTQRCPLKFGSWSYHGFLLDVVNKNPTAEEVMFPGRESYSAYISNTGSVAYNFPTVLTSVCRVNVRYFPFDTQRCPLKFGSWSYHGFLLDVVNKNPTGDIDTYVANNEWEIQEMPVTRTVFFYNCCLEPYPDVTFYVILKRLPTFYVITMLFPCILVSCVSALTFILPTESGEKVSLEITVLLSLAVFLLVVSEALPPASDNFPIIGFYFFAAMVLVSVSLLQTVIIVNVFHRGTNGRRVPSWLKTVCFKYIARVVLVKPHPPGNKVHHIDEEHQKWKECSSMESYTDVPSESSSETNLKPARPDESSDACVTQNGGNEIQHNQEDVRNLRFIPRMVPRTLESHTVKMLRQQNEKIDVVIASVQQKSLDDEINSEWRDVANILDRLFLVFYCLITLITTVAILM